MSSAATIAATSASPTIRVATGIAPSASRLARAQWLADRQAELLDVPYFHVVFTVPEEIAVIAFQNQTVVYDILFRAAAETLRTIAADPEHLGAEIGFLARAAHLGPEPTASSAPALSWSLAAGSRRTANAGSPAGPASSCRSGFCRGCSAGCSCTTWRRRSPPAN